MTNPPLYPSSERAARMEAALAELRHLLLRCEVWHTETVRPLIPTEGQLDPKFNQTVPVYTRPITVMTFFLTNPPDESAKQVWDLGARAVHQAEQTAAQPAAA